MGPKVFFFSIAILLSLFLTGCRKQPPEERTIEFWTTEVEQERMAVQQNLRDGFHKKFPRWNVRIVPVAEDRLDERIAAAKAARSLPDVVRLGLEHLQGYKEAGLLDVRAATEIISELREDSFFDGPLSLLSAGSPHTYVAVPTDGWTQGIWYRTDWFKEKGLSPPSDWAGLLKAAKALCDKEKSIYGIVIGTHPEQPYTGQNFEHIALSNGVRLFGQRGEIAFDEERMEEAISFYKELSEFGPPGHNYWRDARQFYLSGRAAMIFYSPYIVDDIAGLAEGEAPVPRLAENTGFVGTLRGPHGNEAAYGQIVSLAILKGPRTEIAKQWVRFILEEGYLDWCFMTPGGKTPVLRSVLPAWSKQEIFSHYGAGFPETLASGMKSLKRWGYRGGKVYPAISLVYGRNVFPRVLGEVLEERLSPAEAVGEVKTRLKECIEEAEGT